MKAVFYILILASSFVGLLGCGNAERHDARQKFKEAVAAVKVRTHSSTYSEFRQAELDLNTSFEINKTFLSDVSDQFAGLEKLMTATDICWAYRINNSPHPLQRSTDAFKEWRAMQLLSPEITEKLNFDLDHDQKARNPDFYPQNYVQRGLTKVSDQAEVVLSLLAK